MSEPEDWVTDAIAEFTEVSRLINEDKAIREELYDMAMAPVRSDRYVPLGDLLNPGQSTSYKYGGIRNVGAYNAAFRKTYSSAKYPNLAKYVEVIDGELSSRTDPTYGALYYYCPYCEDYSSNPGPFTLAPTVGEVDEGVGYSRNASGTYNEVLVNDAYATKNETLIVGTQLGGAALMGGDPFEIIEICQNGQCCEYRNGVQQGCWPDTPPPGPGPSNPAIPPPTGWEQCPSEPRIFTGWARVGRHMDRLLSIRDGGGAELIIGYVGTNTLVVNTAGQITATSFTGISDVKQFTRRNVNNRHELWWANELIPGWPCTTPQHYFVMYDEDPVGTTTLNPGFTLSVPITIGAFTFAVGTRVGLGSITIQSQDREMWANTYTRDQFFSLNRNSTRGCGSKMTEVTADAVVDRVNFTKYACSSDGTYVQFPDVYR